MLLHHVRQQSTAQLSMVYIRVPAQPRGGLPKLGENHKPFMQQTVCHGVSAHMHGLFAKL